ncbi:CPSF A subunit region-domain-containing protein [Gongronella butleri]|nr:CPSF A subunit region-domain-containing protein [Gongronella butleri]
MAASRYSYITTLHPATAVHGAVKGSFLNPNDVNLITSKGTRIEIYTVVGETLVPALDFNLHCRVASISLVKVQGRSTLSLFVLGDQQHFCLLRYDAHAKQIITEASDSMEEKNARPNDRTLTSQDAQGTYMVTSAFTGLLSIVPLVSPDVKGKGKSHGKATGRLAEKYKPVVSKVSEFNIKGIAALDNPLAATVAVLFEEENAMWLKFYHIKLDDQPLQHMLTIRSTVEFTSHMLLPVPQPYGGVLVVGEYTIGYYNPIHSDTVIVAQSMDAIVVTSYTFIGHQKCVLGDSLGVLYLLTLSGSNFVDEVHIQYLGEASISSCLVYLDNDLLYVGSMQGDSKVVKLVSDENARMSINDVQEFANLSPITDFCLFDLDKQGRHTMVCTSGVHRDGSLRVVQSGLGFLERAVMPIFGVQNVFPLAIDTEGRQHNALVVSTMAGTRVFHQADATSKAMVELTALADLEFNVPTFDARTLANGDMVQVTPTSLRLMKASYNGIMVKQWQPPAGAVIMMAVVSDNYCVLSCVGHLVCIDIGHHDVVEISDRKMDHEVSSLSIMEGGSVSESYVTVGFWHGDNVQILSLETLQTKEKATVANAVPHSMLFQKLEDKRYLFVALGDGKVMHYTLNEQMELGNQSTITIGTRSVSLHAFAIHGQNAVFCASDRPTIITSVRGRLVYSAVNLKNITGFTLFNNPLWPESLMMMTDEAILVGYMDPIRKLHVTKIPLENKMGRRIAYHAESQTLLVGTSQLHRDPDNGRETNTGWIHQYDAKTFQELGKTDLKPRELVESICVAPLWDDFQQYVFVGTVLPKGEGDKEKHFGRVLMFHFGPDHRLQLLDAVEVPGVVYAMKPYKNSLVVGVNGFLYYLTTYRPEAALGERMTLTRKLHTSVLAVDMDTIDDVLVVGDYMQSISSYKLDTKPASAPLVQVARDFNSNWMTAVQIVDRHLYIGAEMSHNVFTVQMPAIDADDKVIGRDQMLRMDTVGQFHLGDAINRIRTGTLGDDIDKGGDEDEEMAEADDQAPWSLMYATVNGAIGTMVGISEADYDMLIRMQDQILAVQTPIGKMDYAAWRSFRNGVRSEPAKGFIDGDLIETFLTLSPTQQAKVADALTVPITTLQAKIEKLSQMR